jgi:hypothetical protein
VLEKDFCESLFFSLNQREKVCFSRDGYVIELKKEPQQKWISISALVFQKDFILLAHRNWAQQMQQKKTLSPYLKIDERELKVFLVQKVPCFFPKQMADLLPRFLSSVRRWSSLIQDLY